MAQKSQNLAHPGAFIREHVIPPGISVKDAAKRLRIGRPALSNLLNGNSSLSSDMAVRLEKAFGADRQKLLELQTEFDRNERSAGEKRVAVRAYVPAFLAIKARQIQDWAENDIESRHHLPVLLRKLAHSTGHELRQLDFPGYDNAERKGWDGLIDAGAATPWIPEGKSCWEFGTTADPRAKAEKDYVARLASIPAPERADITFVFVTPRNWPGKTEWARQKNTAGDWKAVRAYDASDLEQWLEESIPAQIWLAEKLVLPTRGFETLDQCWERWAAASEPRMTPDIFVPSITAHRDAFKSWLKGESHCPFIVAADSKDEALAFIACLLQDSEIAASSKDLAAVFESAETLRTLALSSSASFIPIVCTDEAERELPVVYRRLHCIVVRPRNAVDSEPDITLDLLGHEAFEKALAAMGIERHHAERLARESGRSPTILRRRLSRIDAIKVPRWAREAEIAKTLIPMTLIGAWHAKSKADCEVFSVLADRPYPEIEGSLARLLQFDDCPVWSAGHHRGVASKIDALFAINRFVTEKDLNEFFLLAEYVLSESDPALELPEDQRWAAGLYGKVRDHSGALREGVCETLVILSVHGNNLFRDRLGMDVEARVSLLIRRLLTPLTIEKLLSHDRDLPRYAEAAPDEFLKFLEADLKQPEPVVLGLLRPADSGFFGGCPRTGLLWALECLAWKPRNLSRVSAVLAQLSRTIIEDNWANKPIASLQSIFRSWMPQTAASVKERAKALENLIKRFPDIGWQICIEQFEPGSHVGSYNYRPRWRSDASGAGQRDPTFGERRAFTRKALDLALAWPKHDETTLSDLVERLDGMPAEDQAAVWDHIDAYSDRQTNENAKAHLRERIRRFAFTRRARRRGLKKSTRDRAREAYAKLQPRDPVIRHGWLFAKDWVEESADESADENYNFSQRAERIHKFRSEAIQEIWSECGFDGVMLLVNGSESPYTVGQYAVSCVPRVEDSANFLRRCLSAAGKPEMKIDGCMQGFLMSLDAEARAAVLTSIANGADVDRIVRLFRCAPFCEETWRLLDQYGDEIRTRYWREVFPYLNRYSPSELIELIDRLIEADRPRAAFHAVHMDWKEIETSRLKRLLRAVATTDTEPKGHYKLDAYHISAALQSLDGRSGVTSEEMAQLEFLYIKALDYSKHGIPNLERQIAKSPGIFVQAVALAYKRSDAGQDPPEWRIDDSEQRAAVASAAYRLLNQIKRLPGTEPDGKINAEALSAWLAEVRQLCAQHGRADIGDQCIGQLLSRTPAEETGVWPCVPVCEVMESIASEEIARGFSLGVHNARGVHWRGEGGAQERELAAKYRRWAQQLVFDYPYVGSVLESIAASYDREAEWQDSESRVEKRLLD
jgi:addiction module HigA family antidote